MAEIGFPAGLRDTAARWLEGVTSGCSGCGEAKGYEVHSTHRSGGG